jgi:hypothetical protein
VIDDGISDKRKNYKTVTYLNDAIFVDIFEHFVHHGGDNVFRTTSDGQRDRGGIEIARESLGGENGFSLEEIPFSFMLDEGNKVSDGMHQLELDKVRTKDKCLRVACGFQYEQLGEVLLEGITVGGYRMEKFRVAL